MRKYCILILVLFISCHSRPNKGGDDFTSFHLREDSVGNALIAKYFQKARNSGLDTLSGRDSLLFRLWVESFVKPDLVIEIRKSCDSWSGFQFECLVNDKGNLICGRVGQVDTSVSAIVNAFKDGQIAELPNQSNIRGFRDDLADGVVYILEFRIQGKDKVIEYHCPGRYASQDVSNRKFSEFIDIFSQRYSTRSMMCK